MQKDCVSKTALSDIKSAQDFQQIKKLKHSVDSLHDVTIRMFKVDNQLYYKKLGKSKRETFEMHVDRLISNNQQQMEGVEQSPSLKQINQELLQIGQEVREQ